MLLKFNDFNFSWSEVNIKCVIINKLGERTRCFVGREEEFTNHLSVIGDFTQETNIDLDVVFVPGIGVGQNK